MNRLFGLTSSVKSRLELVNRSSGNDTEIFSRVSRAALIVAAMLLWLVNREETRNFCLDHGTHR